MLGTGPRSRLHPEMGKADLGRRLAQVEAWLLKGASVRATIHSAHPSLRFDSNVPEAEELPAIQDSIVLAHICHRPLSLER